MNDEFHHLDDATREAVIRVVQSARAKPGLQTEHLPNGSDVYAYQKNHGIAWGRNGTDGFCTHRGVFDQ